MPNNAIQAVNDLATNHFQFLQKVVDLNLKTAESLRVKQAELIQEYYDFGKSYTETLLKSQDSAAKQLPNADLLSGFGEKWLSNWRDTAELFKAYNEEFKATTETSLKSFQAGATQLIEAGKQTAAEATEKTKAAVEHATANVADFSKTVTDKAAEPAKKAILK